MSDHTPGPWHRNGHNLAEIIVIHEGPDDKGHTYMDGRHQHTIARCEGPDWEANSRLIAAAPDLLNALMDAVVLSGYRIGGWDEFDTERPAWVETARAAIAKARGGK